VTGNIFQRTMALAVTITIALAMAVGTSVAASAASGPYPIKLLEPASGIFSPAGMAIDPLTGDLVTANPVSGTVGILPKQSGTIFGQAVTANVDVPLYAATGLDQPAGVAFDAAGDLFVSGLTAGSGDALLTLFGVISPTASTILGQVVPANTLTELSSAANISLPLGILVVPDGSLYLASVTGLWEIANLATPPIPVVPATLAATGAPLGTFALVAATFVGAGFVGLDQCRRRRTSQSSRASATASK
jgi:hypothetical protein